MPYLCARPILLSTLTPVLHAQPCQWEAIEGATFSHKVFALAVYDDGAGARLYAGGAFREALGSPASFIAQWDGTEWSQLGAGLSNGVHSLAEVDTFGPSGLYAGGVFYRAGDIARADGIARWAGDEWSGLGAGLYHPEMAHTAKAIVVFDDGSDPAIYVGGRFTEAGGVAARNVARWDGEAWSALGDGLAGLEVRALAVYDDGSGPALYAGGYLDGGGFARWDGESWTTISGGVNYVDSLAVFDDGGGPALYVGGQFGTVGGAPGNGILRWDGASWSPLGAGTDYTVRSLHVFDDGAGPALYAGGAFHHADGKQVWGIAKWDGREWHDLSGGLYGATGMSVNAMTMYDDGSGPALYVAGKFTEAGGFGGVPVQNIARWRCDSACYADCDGSGELDFFDFLCFQNEFAAATLYADCDGSGSGDFFDFLCFQNEFAAGCR